MHEVQHISRYVARPPDEVYAFASDPQHLPRWAAGLARSDVERHGDHWEADAPTGRVRIRFAEPNTFGVMDHDVEMAPGVTVHNPFRVLPNGEGSEVVFSLIRRADQSDEEFADDGAAVRKDLQTLKGLLEAGEDREA